MEFSEIIPILFTVVILPAIIILTKFGVDALKSWTESKLSLIDNETARQYIGEIADIVFQAVQCTSQTYVDALKAQGKFDEEAQKTAFNMTKDSVLKLLTEEAKDFLALMYGDVDHWLDTKIEQMVYEQKQFK